MAEEYEFMSLGHQSPRHADLVVPSGDYATQTGPANVYSPFSGGTSYNFGYGPYTLQAGESINIVVAECAAGMSRDEQLRIGRLYKDGGITALEKNTEVINQGRDSLFKTFRNAITAFQSGWNVPQPPRPPVVFKVNSGVDRISLSWTLNFEDPFPPVEFKVYRALGSYDREYELIATLGAGATSYDDLSVIRGFQYYYHMTCVAESGLESSRSFTQTYDPASLRRAPGKSLSEIRIVPNPYHYKPN